MGICASYPGLQLQLTSCKRGQGRVMPSNVELWELCPMDHQKTEIYIAASQWVCSRLSRPRKLAEIRP